MNEQISNIRANTKNKTLTKKEILSYLSANKELLKRQFNVSKIGLFGSYSTSEPTKTSDIDFIVIGKNIKDDLLKDFLELQFSRDVEIIKESTLYHFMKYLIKKDVIYV